MRSQFLGHSSAVQACSVKWSWGHSLDASCARCGTQPVRGRSHSVATTHLLGRWQPVLDAACARSLAVQLTCARVPMLCRPFKGAVLAQLQQRAAVHALTAGAVPCQCANGVTGSVPCAGFGSEQEWMLPPGAQERPRPPSALIALQWTGGLTEGGTGHGRRWKWCTDGNLRSASWQSLLSNNVMVSA